MRKLHSAPACSRRLPSLSRGRDIARRLPVGAEDHADTLSLFSGIGGLDLGAHLAGLHVAAAVDADKTALSCLSKALGVRTVHGSTEVLDPESVIAAADLPTDGSAFLIGGPPCTAFSHAGFWLDHKRDGTDAQAARIADYWKYVAALRPRAFLMENVPGLTFRNHRAVLDSFVRKARRAGYSAAMRILDSSLFGVPQARRRLFVVGMKSRRRFEFPDPVFSAGVRRTSGWAIADLPPEANPQEPDERLTGKYSGLLPQVPPGDNYLFFTPERGHSNPRFGWRTRYWSFLLKLDPRRPAPTIAATRVSNNGPFHWQNRRLRIRELARLQGFPDQYPLAQLAHARRHLGNAVPPLLAAILIWEMRVQLGDVDRSDFPGSLKLAMDLEASAEEVSAALSYVLQLRKARC